MADLNNIMRLVRIAVFGVASLFAFVVLVLSGLITSFTTTRYGVYFTFAALGIATSLLTLLTLPAMLGLSLVRKGIITSMVTVEIAWTWFLWILWLSVGGTSATTFFIGNCAGYGVYSSQIEAACSEATGVTALGFLCAFCLLFYNVAIISLSFRQHMRGNTGVWTKDITETDFTATGSNTTQIVYDPKVTPTFAPQYPPGTLVQQPSTGSFTQNQAAYPQQAASPYPQPQYTGHSGTSPYPQV